jgi:hypothetical protein
MEMWDSSQSEVKEAESKATKEACMADKKNTI